MIKRDSIPIIIVLLALLDMAFTHYSIILCGGDFSVELNPLMRWVMIKYGWMTAYMVRILLPAIGAPFLSSASKNGHVSAIVALHIAFWSHVLVNVWHVYNIGYFIFIINAQ